MNKILKSILLGVSLLAIVPAVPAQAHDRRWGVDNNYRSPYHHGHHHDHHGRRSGLNTTEKVILGAIIGGVLVDTANRNRRLEPAPTYVRPLPEPYVTQTCTTREVYDQYNRLISRERFCN